MRKLSSRFFAGTRCHSFGDITYLPTITFSYDTAPARGAWLKDVVPAYALGPEVPRGVLIESLRLAFNQSLWHDGKEPDWIRRVNKFYVAHFRRSYAIEECDLLFAVPSVPLAGLGYVIHDGGFTHHACDAFGLWRLQHIAQLGKLHDPVVTDIDTTGYGIAFDHTRLVHSLDARAIALCMAINNRLDDLDRRTLEVAALSHDVRTPAYGDGAKALDPKFFDEDAHYPELLRGAKWECFRDRYRLREQLLADTVQGKGVLGTLLDIADKSSYLARDVWWYLARYKPNGPATYLRGCADIMNLTEKREHLFALWETVHVRGGDVVFTDARWLADFLRARMLMFKYLYFHPGSRYLETITSIVFLRHLIEVGLLTKEQLLMMGDQQVDYLIRRYIGEEASPTFVSSDECGLMPRVEVFATVRAAEEREQELLREGAAITFLDTHPYPNPALHFLVRRHGKTLSFREAYPSIAEEIEEIGRTTATIKLYHLAVHPDCLLPRLKKIAETFRATRLAAHSSA